MCSLTTLPWSLALGWWSYYAWHQYDRTWCGRLAWVKWEWTPNPKLSIMFLSLSILMRFNFRDCVFFLFGFIIYIFWPETKQWIAWGGGIRILLMCLVLILPLLPAFVQESGAMLTPNINLCWTLVYILISLYI